MITFPAQSPHQTIRSRVHEVKIGITQILEKEHTSAGKVLPAY
jgi:hypothetical protein